MDLISREAALEAVKIPNGEYTNPSERHGIIIARVEARRAIQSIPSIPAVPLDKLCEWLAAHYEPPANISHGKALDDHEFCVTLWRYVLEKMMEEQDAQTEQTGK